MFELPKTIKDNIFSKFINFFIKLFKRKDDIVYIAEKSVVNTESERNDFRQGLQEEIEKNHKKEDIINQIESNPDIIEQLSEERLIQLIELYDEKILKLDNENLQLNNQIRRLQGN